MKKSIIALAFAGLIATGVASAAGLGGSIGVTSDNVFRGLSVNNEKAALVGDINYSIGSFTVGGTAANFQTAGSDIELTAYANYNIAINEMMSVDVGAIHYNYPGDSVWNTNEASIAGNVKLGKLGVQLKTSYSNDYFGTNDNNWYTEVNGAYALPYGLTATAHYGRNDGNFALDNTEDWKVGLTKAFGKNISAEVAYVDTDVDTKLTDSRWVVSAKYTF